MTPPGPPNRKFCGCPSCIKALKAALPLIPMIPTGGVNLDTAGPYLKAGAEALGVGGDLVSAAAPQVQ